MVKNVDNFLVGRELLIKQAMKFMTKYGEKEIFIVDADRKLLGALSDGDIRKWILKGGRLSAAVSAIYNKKPVYARQDYSIEDVKKTMLSRKIESVPVVDDSMRVVDVLVWDDVFASGADKPKEVLKADVVIMAGGKGSRLDPFTRILPKPLIPIGNKPIIEIIMDRFAEFGVKKFYVSLNHKSKLIMYYLEEVKDRFNVVFVEEKMPLGTAGSLKMLGKGISDPFVVTNCDILIESDYPEIVKHHVAQGAALTLVVSYRHYVIPYGVCEIKSGGELRAIKEKPEYDFFVNTGMYVINKELLRLIPKDQAFDITALIDKAKVQGFKIGVFPINEKSWIDIGQWKEYHEAIEKLKVEVS